MESRQRNKSLTPKLTLLVALMGLVSWHCWIEMRAAREGAMGAASDAIACEQIAGRLKVLRDRRSVANTGELEATELSAFIEIASRDSAIKPEQLVRIWPQPARRLADTAYMLKPTQIMFEDVDLKQLTACLAKLGDPDRSSTPLTISEIRLVAPRDEPEGERWQADVVVTYLIYAPQEQSR